MLERVLAGRMQSRGVWREDWVSLCCQVPSGEQSWQKTIKVDLANEKARMCDGKRS